MAHDDDIKTFGKDIGHGLERLRQTGARVRSLGLRIEQVETREHLARRLEAHGERLMETARRLREEEPRGPWYDRDRVVAH